MQHRPRTDIFINGFFVFLSLSAGIIIIRKQCEIKYMSAADDWSIIQFGDSAECTENDEHHCVRMSIRMNNCSLQSVKIPYKNQFFINLNLVINTKY